MHQRMPLERFVASLPMRLYGRGDKSGASKFAYLDNESLASPSRCGADHAHVVCLHDEVLQAVEDTSARGRDAAVDAALVDGLAGDARVRVDV